MKHGLRLAGAMLAVSSLLAACGTTADPDAGSEQPGGGGEAPAGKKYTVGEPLKVKDGKVLRIGVSFPILDQFLQTVADGVTSRAKQNGVQVSIVSAQEKSDVQLGQIENFISQGVDGIIVIPQDTDATDPITEKAMAAKVPLVYINRRPASQPEGITYVGSDSVVAGRLQMEALAKLVGNKGNVAILQGDVSQEAARLRTQGCKDIAKKYNMPVTKEASGLWARDKGLQITENWLQTGDPIAVICSNNDEMALGAIKALENAGKLGTIKVGGVDATKDALAAMAQKKLDVSVFQDAKGQGAGGVDAIVQRYNKEVVPQYYDVPYLLVTPSNMNQFVNR